MHFEIINSCGMWRDITWLGVLEKVVERRPLIAHPHLLMEATHEQFLPAQVTSNGYH